MSSRRPEGPPYATFSAQILVPALPESVLVRPTLERRLEAALDHQLTVVTAGAGFGKSTLLASWSAGAHPAWYSLTDDDRLLARFAGGLLDAIRLRVPDLPSDLVTALTGSGGPEADAADAPRARAYAGLLAQALQELLRRPLVLVLDDLHELGASGGPIRLIEALVRQAPPALRIALLSRDDLPFPIERLRGQGRVGELTARDLAFGLDEAAALVELRLGGEAESLAGQLHAMSGGWPAGLTMAIELLRSVPQAERAEALARVTSPSGPLFAYLAEEVFASAAPASRDLVATAARLPRFSADLCAAIGIPAAATTINALERRGVFLAPDSSAGDGWYRLTPLVRQFALDRLDGPGARRLGRAAEWFAAHGAPVAALRTLLTHGSRPAITRLLRARGEELLAAGAVSEVLSAYEQIGLAESDPQIEQLVGQARQVAGDWEGALVHFGRASSGSRRAPGLAWRMGLIHHLRGEIGEAMEIYQQARTDEEAPMREVALLLAWRASARWLVGDVDGCRRDAGHALEVARRVDDDQALAAAYTVRAMLAAVEGDRRANEEHYLRALHHAERAGDVLQLIRIRTNRGSRLVEESAYEEAIAELEIALRLADLAGFAAFRGLSLANRGEARLRLGRIDEAIADLEAARDVYQRIGSRMVAYALAHLGDVYLVRGDRALARQAFEEALALGERSGDLQALVPSLAGLALAIIDDDPASAAALARRALDAAGGMGRVVALLVSSRVALARDDRPAAERHASEAEAAARERRDKAGLAEAIELGGLSCADATAARRRLEEALGLWRDVRDPVAEARAMISLSYAVSPVEGRELCIQAEGRLRELGARALARQAAARLAEIEERLRPELAVQALGGFRVLRGGAPVPLTEWQSRKARDLLKILVARRGRPVTREMMMEILWPDEDPDRLGNRLSVALTTLRGVLDPERRHDQEYFVAADRQAISLRSDHVSVDVEDFLDHAKAGLEFLRGGARTDALDRLVAAETAYAGDFLEEEMYEDWAVPLREQARAAYIDVARSLADHAEADGKHEAAVRYLLRILERDAYDEQAHLALVSTLEVAGQHGEARRAYRTYGSRMEEIGVESAPFPGASSS